MLFIKGNVRLDVAHMHKVAEPAHVYLNDPEQAANHLSIWVLNATLSVLLRVRER